MNKKEVLRILNRTRYDLKSFGLLSQSMDITEIMTYLDEKLEEGD